MMKKILVVDDSALMRRMIGDMLSADSRFELSKTAKDGIEALALVKHESFDAIILDINMPNMNGIEFLEALQKENIHANVLVVSTDTVDGAEVTMKALELGALDFIQKPKNTLDSRQPEFKSHFLNLLDAVCNVKNYHLTHHGTDKKKELDNGLLNRVRAKTITSTGSSKIVALACSTGGPKALQHVIPLLPANMDAPMLIVQHMPVGFTKSLAERLDSLSKVKVTEAKEGDVLEKGHVYISKGGAHMKYNPAKNSIYYSDEPPREGVKPCANYMYESLIGSSFDNITCVVMTGMGADGTAGIKALDKAVKENKNIVTGGAKILRVIAQNEASSTVYGMPKNIFATGLVDQVVDLDSIAQEIIMNVGVR